MSAASSGGGVNYGWNEMEGSECFQNNCDASLFEPPIHEYDRSIGCSVTGGYVYRGSAISSEQGNYFFADYCSNRVFSFRVRNNRRRRFRERTSELTPQGGFSGITSFGEDAGGELYICDADGTIYRMIGN